MNEITLQNIDSTDPVKKAKRRKKRPLSKKEKLVRFINQHMISLTVAVCLASLLGLYGYLNYHNGYKDEGTQLSRLVNNNQFFIESKLHGGTTSVPKDMAAVASKLRAIPEGIIETKNGLMSSYGTRATLMSYGKSVQITYYDLDKKQCTKAAVEENKQANSVSINGSFEFNGIHTVSYVPSLCVLQKNTVTWSLKR